MAYFTVRLSWSQTDEAYIIVQATSSEHAKHKAKMYAPQARYVEVVATSVTMI
jgi:hypothetical protein